MKQIHFRAFDQAGKLAQEQGKSLIETMRLVSFIGRCYKAGVITTRQRKELDGVTGSTDPARVLKILTSKR